MDMNNNYFEADDSRLDHACLGWPGGLVAVAIVSGRKSYDPRTSPARDLHLVARGRRIQLLDETKRSRSVFLVSGYGGN